MPKTVSILGAGRVGRTLGGRLSELGRKIGIVPGTTPASDCKGIQFIGAGRAQAGITSELAAGTTILPTVPDDAIALVADKLAQAVGELCGAGSFRTQAALSKLKYWRRPGIVAHMPGPCIHCKLLPGQIILDWSALRGYCRRIRTN